MSLRVLLADESSTIKKVIQLSLQDFNVDVKSVSVGLDVLAVAKTYLPDIVLADVLLAKRSGYEVCHDLKNDPATNTIPVVLMWSGFMEIDEQKARLCGADRRLEKPFDAAGLRQIVNELVTKSLTNPVSSFLQFPPLPPFDEPKNIPVAPPQAPTPPGAPQPNASDDNDGALVIDDTESDDEWVQQPIAKGTPTAHQSQPTAPAAPSFPLPSSPKPKEDEFTEFSLTQQPAPKAQPQPVAPVFSQPVPQPVAPAIDDIARQEIQKWIAQHMPAIAERIIRDEINRLLQESEQSIQVP